MRLLMLSMLLTSSLAMGFPGLDMFKKKLAAEQKTRTSSARSTECINFAGTWKGVCHSSEGMTTNDTMKIRQFTCDGIYFGDEYHELGSVRNGSFGGSQNSVAWIEAYVWKDASQQVITARYNQIETVDGESFWDHEDGKYELFKEGAELVTKGVSRSEAVTIEQNCRYSPAQ
jgi:hypothetical protein